MEENFVGIKKSRIFVNRIERGRRTQEAGGKEE